MWSKLTIAAFIVICLGSCNSDNITEKDAIEYINSFIGSTGPNESDYGETIPSVAPPFAMTQWCAMTRENHISQNPYNYKDSSLIGFIGTHQPAIWMGDYGFVTMLPSTGKVKISANERAMRYSHSDEKASPWYYSVVAQTETVKRVKTEMAATLRCALLNITFPTGEDNHLFVEASRKIPDEKEFEGFIEILPESNEIIGYNSEGYSYMLN